VNLSGSYRITSGAHYDLVSKYRKIAGANPTVSLHDFVSNSLNNQKSEISIIPHYVGANGQPKYPVTKEYAMSVLLVYKPWAGPSPPHLKDEEWMNQG
jgi:hypothetical protein